ncbi:helix-turn-helix domain-containing protein [Chryseobacterium daeguense]|uniref:helix-turn-helix domain-containing protein n=1 Tax=Chryseobacterium daeguense TaxID=412438 RepID=UPI0003FB38BC|nr:helix-turn-helix domain-containing protein [Chryseobacterium daeguense]
MTKNLFFILFLCSTISAQKNETPPENFYKKIIDEIAPKDPIRALKMADSLTKIAKTEKVKGRAYMLTANITFMQNKYEESIKYAEKAKDFLDKTDSYDLQARIRGLLAEEYRYVKLDRKSKKYLKEGLKIADKITNPRIQIKVKARFCAELTEQEIINDNIDDALKYQLKGLELLSNIPEDTINIGHAYQTLGTLYYYKKNYKRAEINFLKAIKMLPESANDKAIAYDGLGKVLVTYKNYNEAEKLFLKTLNFAETAQHTDIKKLASKSLADLYEKTKQFEKANFYRKKYVENLRADYFNTAELVDKNYNTIETEKNKYANWNSTKNIVISIAFFLIVILFIVFIIYRKKQKEKYKKFKSIIDHYKEKEEYVLETKIITSEAEENTLQEADTEIKQNDIAINKETETKILAQLDQFEKDEMYNNSFVSLSYLATEFNTNIRYISYVVKKHKSADFKGYINKLRINYIIHKLNTSAKYRKYKVGALAEECGFSSHSKFTTIFKSITGISPSTFISFIEQEEAKKIKK